MGARILFLVPFTPLALYLGFLFPYASGRNFFFRAVALAACAAWVCAWIKNPGQYRPHFSFLAWAVLAFAAVAGAATIFAPNPSFAFWSTLERMDGLAGVLFLVLFFFSARALFGAREWRIFWNVSLGAALAVSCIALLQLAGIVEIHQGGVRIDATLGNALFFAVYMFLSAGLALFLSVGAGGRKMRAFYIACAAFFLILAFVSGTRSVLVAFPVALLAATAVLLRFPALRRFGVIILSLGALFVCIFFAARELETMRASPVLGRLLSVSFTGQDAEARAFAWKIALAGSVERPLLGLGPEGYRYVFTEHYDPRLYGREQWFDRAHNEYFDTLVETGALGLLVYFALWVGLVRALRRGNFSPGEKTALVGMFAGYAALNMFSFDTVTASILFFAFLAYVDTRASQNTKTSPQPPLKGGDRDISPLREVPPAVGWGRRMFFMTLVCATALLIFYYAIAKPAYAAYLIHEGLQNPSPDLETRLAFFERAIALRTFATPEAREFLAQFATDVEPALVRAESRARVVSLAHEELARQIEAAPMDPRYPLRLGVVLNAYGQYEAAIPFIEKALSFSPRKQPTLYELGTSYLNLRRFDEAVEVFKAAADVLPGHQDLESKKLYAIALVYARRFTEADAYMERIFNESVFADSRLADAYRRVGRSSIADDIMGRIAEYERLQDRGVDIR